CSGGDRQLRDQVFGVRVAQGGGEPERGGVCGGHGVPIKKGGPCPGVGEEVAGQVGRVAVEDAQGLHQPGVAGGVGQDVRQAVEQDGGGRLQGVEEGAEGGPDRAGGGGGGAEQAVAAGRLGQVAQVEALLEGQPEGVGECPQHLGGRVAVAALLQPGEVLDADARQCGQLGPAQARCAPTWSLVQADVAGFDRFPEGAQIG